jgi:hypothetical protein
VRCRQHQRRVIERHHLREQLGNGGVKRDVLVCRKLEHRWHLRESFELGRIFDDRRDRQRKHLLRQLLLLEQFFEQLLLLEQFFEQLLG